jgi:hypothetical protein
MSRIARAVFRLTCAFQANPGLSLTRDELEHLTELDPDELDVVVDAMVSGGALARNGSSVHGGATVRIVGSHTYSARLG